MTKLTFDYNFYALKIRSVIEIVTNIVNQHLVEMCWHLYETKMKHTCHMSMVARDWNGADNESSSVARGGTMGH